MPWEASGPVPKTNVGRALKRRQRRRSSASAVLVPLFLGAALLGIVFFLAWKPPEKLEGTLTGTALADESSEVVAFLMPEGSDVPEEVVKAVLDHFESHPQPLLSERMRVDFRGDKRGLMVSISPRNQMEMVVVDTSTNRALGKFAHDNAVLLESARQRELAPAVKQFFTAYEAATQADAPMADLPSFRDKLGLASMTKGLGYCLQAVVTGTAYRCVYEDESGRLWFIVPGNTPAFVLDGRVLPDGTTLFPGRYVVSVSRPVAKPEKPAPKEQSEEMEPKEMSPEPADGEMKPGRMTAPPNS